MKKIFLSILLIANVYAYSQTIRFTNQVRQTKVGGIYRLQIDSSTTGNYRNFATQEYVQGYVYEHGGISYSAGGGINITNGVISLNSIQGFVAQGSNVTITGSGTLASPYLISATGTGDAGVNFNVGSSYRWVVANTQNIKTFANGVGFLLDSLTANTLTGKVDTNLISTRAWRQKGIDSVVGLLSSYATTSSLSNYVPATTLISSGYGLLGGGQLNANRTMLVDTNLISTRAWGKKGVDSAVAVSVQISGSYANPSWITSIAWGKITSTPTTIADYGITDYNSLWDTRLATKTTDNLTEGSTNKYFSNSQARNAISLTTTGTSGAATYNNTTGILNIPNYSGAFSGSLVVSLTDGATINTDASQGYLLGSTYRVTLEGNRTIANPTNPSDGQRIVYELKQDAIGSRTVTWGSKFVWSDDIPVVTLSTTAGYVDLVAWVYNATADKYYITGANIGIH